MCSNLSPLTWSVITYRLKRVKRGKLFSQVDVVSPGQSSFSRNRSSSFSHEFFWESKINIDSTKFIQLCINYKTRKVSQCPHFTVRFSSIMVQNTYTSTNTYLASQPHFLLRKKINPKIISLNNVAFLL